MCNDLHSSQADLEPQRLSKQRENHILDAQAWTAARCHRLLRPITSRIELLKKDPVQSPPSLAIPTECHRRPPNSTVVPNDRVSKNGQSVEDDDRFWEPARKRVRKTYSAKCKTRADVSEATSEISTALRQKILVNKTSLRPGEVSVPTPILNRTRTVDQDSYQAPTRDALLEPTKSKTRRRPLSRYTTKDGDAHFQLAETMRQISKATTVSRYKMYEGIYNALEALLRATAPHHEGVMLPENDNICRAGSRSFYEEKGPRLRSLFSMCLRSVPSHIKEEERLAAVEAEATGVRSAFDTRIISAETYSYLESFGTSSRGWKHLRTIVRAHAIRAVSDAVEEGFIDAKCASALVMLCVHTCALDDAETLLRSLLFTFRYPIPQTSNSRICDYPAMLPLETLDKFVRYTERTNYYQRQMVELITTGILPVSWLSTKDFASVWTSVFRSLAADPSNRDATAFMCSMLPAICTSGMSSSTKRDEWTPDQNMLSVLNTTLTSVLTTLSAMSLLNSRHTRPILQLLRSVIVDCHSVDPTLGGNHTSLIAVANVLLDTEVQSVGCAKHINVVLGSLSSSSLAGQRLKNDVTDFICGIARCCGRGFLEDGFNFLKTMLERLRTLLTVDLAEGDLVLREIIVDCAFSFAQYMPDRKHLQYAQNTRLEVLGIHVPAGSSSSKCNPDREAFFRWEEGISEWVTVTPVVSLRKGCNTNGFPSLEELNADTPLRPRKRQYRSPRNRQSSFLRISDLGAPSPTMSRMIPNLRAQDVSLLCGQSTGSVYSAVASLRTTGLCNVKGSFSKKTNPKRQLSCNNQDWRILEESDESDDELSLSIPSTLEAIEAALLERPCGANLKRNKPANRYLEYKNGCLAIPDAYTVGESEDELML
jgi:hypothetical protein